jgi:hypothetical protein
MPGRCEIQIQISNLRRRGGGGWIGVRGGQREKERLKGVLNPVGAVEKNDTRTCIRPALGRLTLITLLHRAIIYDACATKSVTIEKSGGSEIPKDSKRSQQEPAI